MLRRRKERSRTRRIPGPEIRRLAPTHDPRDARPLIPGHHRTPRQKRGPETGQQLKSLKSENDKPDSTRPTTNTPTPHRPHTRRNPQTPPHSPRPKRRPDQNRPRTALVKMAACPSNPRPPLPLPPSSTPPGPSDLAL